MSPAVHFSSVALQVPSGSLAWAWKTLGFSENVFIQSINHAAGDAPYYVSLKKRIAGADIACDQVANKSL